MHNRCRCKHILVLLLFFVAETLFAQTQNRLQLARRYAATGENEKAVSLYSELYREDPQIFVYRGYLACLQDLERFDDAEKLIRRQMKSVHLPVLVKVDLAQNYLLQNKKDKAEAVMREIVGKTDFRQAGLSVEELAEDIVNKTRMYDAAIAVYLGARSAEEPYTAQLANLYRLNGQYELMLDEYIDLLHSEKEREEEVYARLQGLLAGAAENRGAAENTRGAKNTGVAANRDAAENRGAAGQAKKNSRLLLQLIYKKAQAEPEDEIVQNLLIWALLQEKEAEAALNQARAYSLRFNDKGACWYQTIVTVRENRYYDLAKAQYEAFIQQAAGNEKRFDSKLSRKCRIDLLNLYFERLESGKIKDSVQVEKIKRDYKNLFAELGNDPETFTLYRNLAKIYAYHSHERDSARQLLEKALTLPGFNARQKAQLKTDLADILLYYNKVWDATLLYSQVEKDFKQDAAGFYAKLQNARLSYYIGEFEWAKSQLEVLRAATSKLIANDAMELSLLIKEGMNPDSAYDGLEKVAQADLAAFRNLYNEALQLLDEVLTMPLEYGLYDEVYLRKARIYIKTDSIDKALQSLEKIYADNTDDLLVDDALFMAGGLLQLRSGEAIDPETEFLEPSDFPPVDAAVWGSRSEERSRQDREAAMVLYQKLFTEYRASALAPLARQRYRQLRKD